MCCIAWCAYELVKQAAFNAKGKCRKTKCIYVNQLAQATRTTCQRQSAAEIYYGVDARQSIGLNTITRRTCESNLRAYFAVAPHVLPSHSIPTVPQSQLNGQGIEAGLFFAYKLFISVNATVVDLLGRFHIILM